ncbi:hypothetical protein GLOIN_2v1772633 [Rhizophagus clarus]|uniref:Uncharacterized protein n=1 Tax=Rhizophagus clarus TaxID=94130 RepID=A0A8H3LUU3_9GLOM|nr:hypothetical protein GLOIN_2v1772633 [Rhizophagus clarus]
MNLLTKDLAYIEIGIDNTILENFIYEELKKKLEEQTIHIRKSSFILKSTYIIKKVIRKVVSNKASAKQTWYYSAYEKEENPENSEEYIVEKKENTDDKL